VTSTRRIRLRLFLLAAVLLGFMVIVGLIIIWVPDSDRPFSVEGREVTLLDPGFEFTLEEAFSGFDRPLYLTHAGDDSGRLFVVEKGGTIQVIGPDGETLDTPFLDIQDRVNSASSEQGLLGLVFHPDYESNGYFYVNYTGEGGTSHVGRFSVTDDPDVADPDSEFTLMTVEQPAPNHNAGQLEFGPDGYLYISWGDGGALGDVFKNAQNGETLLGALLRIDVDNVPEGEPYGIPEDNPFVDNEFFLDEIWAYGVRNPWRFSFDAETGDLYIADVGQGQFEEINVQPADSSGGQNYGWPITEGFSCYPSPQICKKTGLDLPIAHYNHTQGCSITGGYVYRGDVYPQLEGIYVFGDYCSGRIWGLQQTAQGGWQVLDFDQHPITLSSFGQDAENEVYAIGYGDGIIYRVGAR